MEVGKKTRSLTFCAIRNVAKKRKEMHKIAKRRGVKLIILKMKEAIKYYLDNFGPDINAIFHITC